MNEDYLWDRTGNPDPEILRLEQLLGALQYSESSIKPRKSHNFRWFAAAAVFAAALLSLPFVFRGHVTNWQLSDGRRVRTGQVIETDALHPTEIHSDDTGEVTIDPGSRIRLLAANNREQRFDLQQGMIHAFIWASPGQFVVNTPSSKATDLGCRYTLQVSKNGTGLLTVELGWVAFERNHVESFIPAEAACITRPNRGPGTPYFTDAPPSFRTALARFDTTNDPTALITAIQTARPRDALSLWHLMVRTQGAQRAEVFDRLSTLIHLPPEANRQAILEGNAKAIDAAWNALDLGNTDWWRSWKKQWHSENN